VKRALLVTNSEQSAVSLSQLLRNEGYVKITTSFSAYNAREAFEEDAGEYDLVCVNAPLPDENGIELSSQLAASSRAGVVIIVPQKNAAKVTDYLSEHGVLVIPKPVNKHLFHNYLRFTDCFRARLLRVEEENIRLKNMVEDIKIIDRAKLLLVTCLNMSESQAHKYLEKQAMDLRTTKLAVAKQVISTYEN
jgi:response regulator NasT